MSAARHTSDRRGRHAAPAPARGLGAAAILLVLVLLAGMAAAVLKTTRQSHVTATQDLLALQAQSAAQAGIEWGLYNVFKGGWGDCNGIMGRTETLDLRAITGMTVRVACASLLYNEGELDGAPGTAAPLRIVTIDAIACNDNSAYAACPSGNGAVRLGYVERARRVQVVN